MILTSDVALIDGRREEGWALAIEDGVIKEVGPRERLERSDEPILDLGRRAMLPGTVNVHNHSFQSLLRGIGDDLPFLEWRDRALYRYSPVIAEGGVGVHTGALFAFGEMLLHGVTTVCDFFYINAGSNENAGQIISAAQQLGIRVVLARCFYDWDGAPSVYRESPNTAQKRFEELHRAFVGSSMVSIQAAPHSLHGASEAMIRAAVDSARAAGVPWHIHLAEEEYQIGDALKRYGARPMHVLDRWRLLGDDLVAVHGCWFDAAERARLAECGGSLAYNPGSNMFLGDGVTDIVDLVEQKVTIGLGTDGGCSNSRVSVFDEMRQCALLQKVHRTNGQAIDAETVFAMGTRDGGKLLRLPVGRLAPDFRADVVFVDLDDPSLWPEQQLVKNVVYSLSSRAVTDVFVDGKPVVRDRELVNVELAAIQAKVRALTATW